MLDSIIVDILIYITKTNDIVYCYEQKVSFVLNFNIHEDNKFHAHMIRA